MPAIKFFFVVLSLTLTITINGCHKSIRDESSSNAPILQLMLEMEDSYYNEDEILPKIRITNRSTDSLALVKPLYPFTLHFIIQDSLGKNVPEYLVVDYAFKNLETNLVPPNESIMVIVSDLKEIYQFKPGSYHFQAFYGVPSDHNKRINFAVNKQNNMDKFFVGYVYSNKKTVHIGKLKFKFSK